MSDSTVNSGAKKVPLPIRALECLFALLPYAVVVFIGKAVGFIAYYVSPGQRKRVMSNLAIAHALNFSEAEMKRIARASFQNLYVVTLDYLKMRRNPDYLHRWLSTINAEPSSNLQQQGKGMVFFTGHLGNWEVTNLEASSRLQGSVVAQSFFVPAVSGWIDSLRGQFGAKILRPEQAVTKGIEVLRQGGFVGVAGDQALPEGSHYYSFLGTRAFTSITPALWACRTQSPIILVFAIRRGARYEVHYSEPIYPEAGAPFKTEIRRLMLRLLAELESVISQYPEQYLWLHNRWSQHASTTVLKPFQHDFIRVVLPGAVEQARLIWPQLVVLAELYPRAFITVMKPQGLDESAVLQSCDDGVQYQEQCFGNEQAMLVNDWRTQLVFNFSANAAVGKHYLKLAAFQCVELPLDAGSCAAKLIREAVVDKAKT